MYPIGSTPRAWLFLSILCAVGLGSPAAFAQGEPEEDAGEETGNNPEFDALVAQAQERYAEEDFEGAIAAFKQAYAVQPTESNILYNIGRLYEKMGDFEAAIEYYEKFVNEPDIAIDARQDAVARIKTLREVLAMRKEKETPKEVEKPDPPEEKKPEVTPPPEVEPKKRKLGLPITFLVLGGGALATGGAFTYLTGVSATEAETARENGDLAGMRAANESGITRALVADSLLIGGGVLTAIGVVFLVRSGRQDTPSSVELTPLIRREGAGMGLTISF